MSLKVTNKEQLNHSSLAHCLTLFFFNDWFKMNLKDEVIEAIGERIRKQREEEEHEQLSLF